MGLVLGFSSFNSLAGAYGIAVTATMAIDSNPDLLRHAQAVEL